MSDLTNFRIPGPMGSASGDEARFERELVLLKAEIANVAAHVNNEVAVRQAYQTQIQAFVTDLRGKANAGGISWSEAATQANVARNTIMETMRARSTPVGRALAESLKKQGKTLNEMVAKKTIELYGARANFPGLSPAQQNKVFEAVTLSAAKSRPSVDRAMRILRPAGRGLVFLSIALSVYTVATSEDKVDAAKKEAATIGGGIAGGIAGGAAAGLICGPGAPVCVTVGAFVGGALAAFGVGFFW
jgi:hypothetical protein